MKALFTFLLAAFAMTAFAATDAVTKQDKHDVPAKAASAPAKAASAPAKKEEKKDAKAEAKKPEAKASEPVKK